jgi:hypothetical protein
MKILFLSVFLLPFSFLFSQGNLQFNQVINITNGQTYTVPAGKVLKVEAIFHNGNFPLPFQTCTPIGNGNIYCDYNLNNIICIDAVCISGFKRITGGNICNCPTTTNENVIDLSKIELPIWLKEGKTISIQNGSGIEVSAIEFNIIP